ncbi:MAG: glyoxylate/hydroxypyruvate reductase A [Alphaproteobacteria bacterium]
MTILLISKYQDFATWRETFHTLLPGIELRHWPEVGDPADVEMILAWKGPEGALQGFPNLRLICSLGQGVDHLFRYDDLPVDVPMVRLVDDGMRRQMTAYVIAAVTRRLCRMAEYEAAREWHPLAAYDPAATTVGVLGLGALGRNVVETLAHLGFAVRGWSRNPAFIPGVECFNGSGSLAEMLGGCDMVCCLLALTSETRGILDARAFAAMKPGTYLINSARGGHVVEPDLLAALESGQIDGATLDVFEEEPLPADNPLWGHPKVTVTPHISAVTLPYSCAEQIADNYKRMKAGQPLLNAVDPVREY